VDGDNKTCQGGDDEETADGNGTENGATAAGTSRDGGNAKGTKTEVTKPGSTKEIIRFLSANRREDFLVHIHP